MNYDPELNLVYFGTANGAPWSRTKRSPGGGDNLFLSSIVALHADTGEYAWHYQATPGERWDYDATPQLMLATLKLDGADRKVLMQASKNGFFYVIDRATGQLLSADKFVDVNWADGVDLKTGRVIENVKLADYSDGKPKLVFPSAIGAHNFNPMSLSQNTGLVYLATVHVGMLIAEGPKGGEYLPGRMNTRVQVGFSGQLAAPQSLPPALRPLADPAFLKTQPPIEMSAAIKAWDPVNRKVVWEMPATSFNDHGGVLSTGGGLVVQGGLDGKLRIRSDADGKLLKEIEVGTPMIAGASTYTVDGVQYIAILAGAGGGGWNTWTPENAAFHKGNAQSHPGLQARWRLRRRCRRTCRRRVRCPNRPRRSARRQTSLPARNSSAPTAPAATAMHGRRPSRTCAARRRQRTRPSRTSCCMARCSRAACPAGMTCWMKSRWTRSMPTSFRWRGQPMPASRRPRLH